MIEMGLFDKIPTVGEVVESAACLMMDHNWGEWFRINATILNRRCKDCGKIEEMKLEGQGNSE